MSLLDGEVTLNAYEDLIVAAAFNCHSIADVIEFGDINGAVDVQAFVALVSFCMERVRENATN